MAGYGGPDDPAIAAAARVEERVALARSMLPTGPGALNCDECGELIPEPRRAAMPGCRYCIECQSAQDLKRPTYKEPWAT